jgi:hypothetical protein
MNNEKKITLPEMPAPQTHRSDLTLHGFDIAECAVKSTTSEFFAAMNEFRDHGTLGGFYFIQARLNASDTDEDDAYFKARDVLACEVSQ